MEAKELGHLGRRRRNIMRRANEIKIPDADERKLKTKSFFFPFFSFPFSVSPLTIHFNLNQLSSLFYELSEERESSEMKVEKRFQLFFYF